MRFTPFSVTGYLSILLLVILLYLWHTYNSLILKRNQVKEDFSDVDVQLKRRATLIEQLVTVVKAYAKHEKETFESVTRARAAFDSSTSVKEVAHAENMFTQTLRSLFAVVENYPELKADKHFLDLQQQLEETENRVAHYREEYNNSVQRYNNSIQTFPNLLVAGLFGFFEEEFFQIKTVAIPQNI